MSSSFQFQVTNFMSAMACSVASTDSKVQCDQQVEDFSPPISTSASAVQQVQAAQDLALQDYLSAWLPSASTMIATLNLTTTTDFTAHTDQRENSSIRDFGNFIAQLESPSASTFESSEKDKIRITLSERSLTYADFRHAVDHQIDYASSIWQNN